MAFSQNKIMLKPAGGFMPLFIDCPICLTFRRSDLIVSDDRSPHCPRCGKSMVARFDSERRWFFSCLSHPDTTLPAPGRPSEIKKAEIGCVFCHCATQDLPKPTLPKPMPLFVSEKHPAANSQADYDKTTGDHLRRWKSSRDRVAGSNSVMANGTMVIGRRSSPSCFDHPIGQ